MSISSATVQNCDIGSKGFTTNPQSFSSCSRPENHMNEIQVHSAHPHLLKLPGCSPTYWYQPSPSPAHCYLVHYCISWGLFTLPSFCWCRDFACIPFTPCPRFLCASQVFLYNRKTQQEGSFFCTGAARAFFHSLS